MCHKSWSLPTWRLKIAMNVSCPPKKQLLKGDEKLRYFSKFRTPGINLCTHSLPTNGWNGQDSKCFQFWLKHVKVLKHSNLVYKPFKLSVSYDSHVYIYILWLPIQEISGRKSRMPITFRNGLAGCPSWKLAEFHGDWGLQNQQKIVLQGKTRIIQQTTFNQFIRSHLSHW